MEQNIEIQPIGFIRTPFQQVEGVPVQPGGGKGISGWIELEPQWEPGLKDLEGFSHILLVYYFHLVREHKLSVIPFLDNVPHGIFATRSPARPNRIGLSTVRLLKIEGTRIFIENVDMVDQTPLLDIKPFFPLYDNHPEARGGWLESSPGRDISKVRSDGRFK